MGEDCYDEGELELHQATLISALQQLEAGKEPLQALAPIAETSQADVDWIGTFRDLCQEESGASYRSTFRADEAPLDAPITEEELGEFVGFIREFGC